MASSLAFHRTLFLNASPPPSSHQVHPLSFDSTASIPFHLIRIALQGSAISPGQCSRRSVPFQVTASASVSHPPENSGRRQTLILGTIATSLSLCQAESLSFAAEVKKGFQNVLDKKDGYSFVYPFGWEEVVVQGQDKVFKDVIEPLESVSVDLVPTSKQDIRDLGSPQEVAEALIQKVLAPRSQKTKLVEAAQHDVDGKAYYTFEFVAQAPNFSRHALGAVCIGNGKFYTLTTGANERRWEKMKDKLHTVVDSFKIFTPTIL